MILLIFNSMLKAHYSSKSTECDTCTIEGKKCSKHMNILRIFSRKTSVHNLKYTLDTKTNNRGLLVSDSTSKLMISERVSLLCNYMWYCFSSKIPCMFYRGTLFTLVALIKLKVQLPYFFQLS